MADRVERVEQALRELVDSLEGDSVAGRQRELLEKLRHRLHPLLDQARPPPVSLGPEEWARELLDAATRDLSAAKVLATGQGEHAAVVAMLLQMVFEKLALNQALFEKRRLIWTSYEPKGERLG